MTKMMGAKPNMRNILGLIVLAAVALLALWKIADLFTGPVPQPSAGITEERLLDINAARYKMTDSIYRIGNQSILDQFNALKSERKTTDSLIQEFNKKKQYDKDHFSGTLYFSDSLLLRTWAEQYPRR